MIGTVTVTPAGWLRRLRSPHVEHAVELSPVSGFVTGWAFDACSASNPSGSERNSAVRPAPVS